MCDTNENFNVNGIVEQLHRHLSERQAILTVSKQFAASKTNAERVTFVYRLLEADGLLPDIVQDTKNNELAQQTRQKGNEKFKEKKNADAIEFYTQSAALAEDGSEHLALAYANRSAVLLEEGFYEECLMDIYRALNGNYPEKLKPKLITRQENANKLKPQQRKLVYYQPVPQIPENQKSNTIQCASNSVELKFTQDQGRHVVATRDISAGEILAIEKPFCHILIEQFYNHCHHCLKLNYNLIPCKKCTQTLYCSEECLQNSATYHRYECNILATFRKLKMDKLKLLPLKIALLVKDQYPNIKELESVKDYFYRSDRYQEIHLLEPNTSSRSVSDLHFRACTSAIIFHFVKKFTDFSENEEQETVFKELLLLHMQTGACNFHEISELAENTREIYEPLEVGSGAYSFLSMFNHKCRPNVVRDCHGSTIVVRAIESIKKGEQCYDNYGYHHAVMPKADRRAKLRQQYFFDCNCEVCVKDWPLYFNLPRLEIPSPITESDVYKLELAHVESAEGILKKILPKMKELEQVKPNKTLAEVQEIIKQCYALLGNVRKTI